MLGRAVGSSQHLPVGQPRLRKTETKKECTFRMCGIRYGCLEFSDGSMDLTLIQ
jgi:hypothetical protein